MRSASRPSSSGSRTIRPCSATPAISKAFVNTVIFSTAVCFLSLSLALLFAVMADRAIRGAEIFKTLLIWPYAVAPAIAGVLWIFMFDPSLGMLARGLQSLGIAWNPRLNGNDAMLLVILAATWKQISYNFLFFLAGLQSIPKSVIEAAVIDGARPMRRFWTIVFPLLSPTTFFLLVVNIVYVFFDTFGIIDTMTAGRAFGRDRDAGLQGLCGRQGRLQSRRLGGAVGRAAGHGHRDDGGAVQVHRAQGQLLMVEDRRLITDCP